jgi:CheY-like chemotaxis protein
LQGTDFIMKKRILVIDDQPDFSHWLKRALESHGYYEVCEENDPLNAVEAARLFGPDLVILDVMMPQIEGSEVASRFQCDSLLADVPIVFLTALVGGREAPAGICLSGGRTFLPKSVPLPRLIACINQQTRELELAGA